MIDKLSQNPWVELRPSKCHGLGVFAKRDIPKGTFVCYYDGDDYTQQEASKFPYEKSLAHVKDKGMVRIGTDKPRDEWGIGQFANDLYKPKLLKTDLFQNSIQYCKSILYAYDTLSLYETTLRITADFDMFVDESVQKDQELTFHYGIDYWIRELIKESNNAIWRFHLMMCHKNRIPLSDLNEEQCTRVIENVLGIPKDFESWNLIGIDKNFTNKKKLEEMERIFTST